MRQNMHRLISNLITLTCFLFFSCNYGFQPDANVHGAMVKWNCEPKSSAKIIYDDTERAEACLGFTLPEVNVEFVEDANDHCPYTIEVAGCVWDEIYVIAECGSPEVITHERLHVYLCKEYNVDCDMAHESPLWVCVN